MSHLRSLHGPAVSSKHHESRHAIIARSGAPCTPFFHTWGWCAVLTLRHGAHAAGAATGAAHRAGFARIAGRAARGPRLPDGKPRKELFHVRAAAFGAGLPGCLTRLLEHFHHVPALLTSIFKDRHRSLFPSSSFVRRRTAPQRRENSAYPLPQATVRFLALSEPLSESNDPLRIRIWRPNSQSRCRARTAHLGRSRKKMSR